MTSLSLERAAQRSWTFRPRLARMPVFDKLVESEFLSLDEQRRRQSALLSDVVRFAAAHVPYYRDLFARAGLTSRDVSAPEDLPRLPVLTKQDVVQWATALSAERLPPGARRMPPTKSSGTTGAPLQIANTHANTWMFTVLWQRQARWFRLDPHGTFCDVRVGSEIGRQPDGSLNPDGVLQRHPHWRYLGRLFETGPEFAFNNSTAVEQQLAWLRELRPDYVMSYPGVFEELALANHGRIPVDSLRGLIAVGSQLTPSLRGRLEAIYGVPIHQTYGLNEIGKVALRCEAGRYHVHREHCIVEIVDADGRPCPAGETGRVVVTALRNYAMPLFRYDTGDLAEAVAGPCPCGRTLPSFGEIAGRFRRFHGLPAGTRTRVHALLGAFSNLPTDVLEFLREYQLHQDRENRFTLWLRTAGPVPDVFRAAMQRVWTTVAGDPPVPLEIRTVEHIPRAPSGKQLDFVSDFYEDDYARTASREER